MDNLKTEPKGKAQIAKAAETAIRGLGLACGVIILLIGLLMAADVVARYFFNSPLGWTFELNNYLFVAMVFLGGAYALQADAHVRIDIFTSHLSRRTQRIVNLCSSVLALFYLCWLDWLVFRSALHAFRVNEVSMLQSWPLGPVRLLLPIGTTLLIVQLLIQIGRNLVGLKKLKEG